MISYCAAIEDLTCLIAREARGAGRRWGRVTLAVGNAWLAVLVGVWLFVGCQVGEPSAPINGDDAPPAPTTEPPPTPTTGGVAGRVTDLDDPSRNVAGATVTIAGRSVATGSIGDYLIQGVSAGTQVVTAAAPGYDQYSDYVDVVAGSTVRKDFSMARTVQRVVLLPIADAYTNSASPTSNYGSEPSLYTGIVNLVGTPDYVSFVQFDVSSIPQAATIIDATFTVYPCNTGAPSGPVGFTTVYRVAGPSWAEAGVTYQNQPSPFLTALWTSQVTFAAGPAVDFYVDDAVEAWVNAGDPSFGLMVNTGNLSSTYHYACYYSREVRSFEPRLTIEYLNP